MRVLIADDEPMSRSLLRALLADAGDVKIVGEAGCGSEAVALSERLRPDAVFLDIAMPGASGFAAAHELGSRCPAEIVFVTAHESHAADAFELGAADYLLKPVRRPRLAKALDRVRARLRAKSAFQPGGDAKAADAAFWVRTRQGATRLQISDIVRIEAARDHVYLHTARQTYLHRITMDELERKLQGTGMVRVQRSAFVRLAQVTAILRRGKLVLLELADETEVAVGPSYQTRVLAALTGEVGYRI